MLNALSRPTPVYYYFSSHRFALLILLRTYFCYIPEFHSILSDLTSIVQTSRSFAL